MKFIRNSSISADFPTFMKRTMNRFETLVLLTDLCLTNESLGRLFFESLVFIKMFSLLHLNFSM